MLIYVVRHGIAIDRADPNCPPDPERALTGKGIRRTRQAARGFALLHEKPARVISSPYTRARETATLFCDAFDLPDSTIEESDRLLPDAPGRGAAEFLMENGKSPVMCVGHAPNLDYLVAALLGVRECVTDLKKSGVAVLACDGIDGGGLVQALYTPKGLRALVSTEKNK